jgi:hypothetical protein
MMKKKPIRSKLHSADKTIAVSKLKDLERLENSVSEETIRTEKRQLEIDNYNFEEVNVVDDYFKGISFVDSALIVRLHKENYIKEVSIMPNGVVIYDAWISQVDGRMNKAEREKWVDNPLPYVFSGVIVAISPLAQMEYVKKKETLSDELKDSFKVPEVGDIVNLDHFMVADRRYYPNKQARDFIKNPEEYRIVHFDGYVKIHPSLIEGIVVDKNDFYNNISPFQNFIKFKQNGGLDQIKNEYEEKYGKETTRMD